MLATTAVDALVGTGASQRPAAPAAAAEAVEAVLGGRAPAAGDVLLVLATLDHDPETLIGAVRRLAGPARSVGISATAGMHSRSPAPQPVVVAHLRAGGLTVGVGAASARALGRRHAAARAVREARADAAARGARPSDPAAVVLLAEGIAGDQRETVRGAYDVAGARVPIVGGTAGGDLAGSPTWQWAQDRPWARGVMALWLASDRPIGAATGHGWHPIGAPMQVTRARGRRICELDGRPALAAYLDQRGTPDPGAAAGFGGAILDRPLGMPDAAGGYDVRHVMGHDGDELVLFGHVPETGVVRLMAADPAGLVAGARRASAEAAREAGSGERGGLVFSCAARRVLLDGVISEEIGACTAPLGPAAGMFTYGEFARLPGSTGFHNASVSVLAL